MTSRREVAAHPDGGEHAFDFGHRQQAVLNFACGGARGCESRTSGHLQADQDESGVVLGQELRREYAKQDQREPAYERRDRQEHDPPAVAKRRLQCAAITDLQAGKAGIPYSRERGHRMPRASFVARTTTVAQAIPPAGQQWREGERDGE